MFLCFADIVKSICVSSEIFRRNS